MPDTLQRYRVALMQNLTGKLLIAMPGMQDPHFCNSVVFLWEHSPQRTLGVIVNKPAPEVRPEELFDQLGIERSASADALSIHYGGPVESGRGFVLHSRDYSRNTSTLPVTEAVGMTATLDILQDIAEDRGPSQAILALGCAGWGPGQLEDEIQANGWLTTDADSDIVFHDDDSFKWSLALKSLGVDAIALSSAAGHA
ncbi:MAG: YqgE/AlgH family protein [Pseudomonadota bacterium]